ncbi:MAG TPA: AMP-binding protein [Acidimicrobiia bacterium]|nr:AMP-binding protein [Acidimicrobiia bacterium]
MPSHLRAFLFDPTKASGSTLIENVFSSWNNGDAITVIPSTYPQSLIDASIIRCDPSDVHDLASGEIHRRELAIVETPDLAAVVLTSGTTADPKPVELSFASMKASADALYEMCDLSSDDVWLCCLPPYYIAGLAIFARCFSTDSTLVFHEHFDVTRVEDSLKNESITAISLVSSQLHKLLDAKIDLSGLKTVLVGGSAVRSELIDTCSQQGIAIHQTYGMTETWGGICHDGILFDNTQARISDDIIELSSTSLMSGYRHDYPATLARITPDGWFRTFDRGKIQDGRLHVLGRNDDVINSGGIKVDPLSLEAKLHDLYPEHAFIVCATPHKNLGSCVTLCFHGSTSDLPELEDIRKRLIEYVPSTHLPLRLATIDQLPFSETGKVKRSATAQLCTVVDEHELKG